MADAVKQHNRRKRENNKVCSWDYPRKGKRGGEDSQAGGWRIQASHQKKPQVNTATTLGLYLNHRISQYNTGITSIFESDARSEPRSMNQTMVVLHIYRVACLFYIYIYICSLGWSIFRLEVLCFNWVEVCTVIMQNMLYSILCRFKDCCQAPVCFWG